MNRFIPVVLLGVAAGCTTNKVAQVGEGPRELISYAATAKYPGSAQDADKQVHVVAFDVPRERRLELYNLGDQPVPVKAVWVNGGFVSKVDGPIPPKGRVTVGHASLLEAGSGTSDVESARQAVNRVEVQTADGLFRAEGPISR